MQSGPSIWTLDIETAPYEGYFWDIWEQNIGLNQIKVEWSILSYCAKRLGSKEVLYQDTYGRGLAKVRDDSKVLQGLHKILSEADIIITQNGKKFDIRKITARFLMADMPPPPPIRVIDTKIEAKKVASVTSTRLEWLSKYLTDTPKYEHRKFPGFELWSECLKYNPEAWAEMRKYNPIDVVATEKVYLRLRPYITQHPNLAAYTDDTEITCPRCGSDKMQSRGTLTTQQGRYARYQCQSCKGWSRGKTNLLDKAKRKALQVQ